MLRRKSHKFIGYFKQHKKLVFISMFAFLGAFSILISSAESVWVGVEPEQSSLTGCASIVSDTASSGGYAVKFGNELNSCSLDPTGKTIPRTNYARPSDAVYMSNDGVDTNAGTEAAPVKTFNAAYNLAKGRSSKTIVVRGGEYRDHYKDSSASTVDTIETNITIQAYPNESPWFIGSDPITTGWSPSGSVWVRDWSTPQFCQGTYNVPLGGISPVSYKQVGSNDEFNRCTWADSSWDPAYPVAADPQMAFIGQQQLTQKGTLAEVTPGSKTFYYDWNAKKIYVSESPSTNTIELTTRPGFTTFGGAFSFAVKGIGFKRFGSVHRGGNVGGSVIYSGLGGANNPTTGEAIFESTVFTENAGANLDFSGPKNGTAIRNSVFAFNHGIGVQGNGYANSSPGAPNKILIEGTIFNSNNLGMFDTKCTRSCAAAAVKLNNMAGFTVRNSLFENTKAKAPGLWCDIDCSNGVMVNNVIRNNGGRGIFYEISSKGIIAGNLVYHNDQANISVFSATTKMYNNTVINKIGPAVESFWISDDKRPAPDKGETWPYAIDAMKAAHAALGVDYGVRVGPNTNGLEIANNVVVAQPPNADGTLGARLMNFEDFSNTGATWAKPPNTFSNEYFKVLNGNIYYHLPNKNIYKWARTDAIKSPSQLRTVSGQNWETNAISVSDGSNPFINQAANDFRINTSSQAYTNKGVAIPADVCAAMGLTSAECSSPSRGASVPSIFY
jgi:parallel beta-helix repeat protein